MDGIWVSDDELERLAKLAAETVNGSDFYDNRWFQFKHREAWMKGIAAVLKEYDKEPLRDD
jgi:hypothetical protein